MQASRTPLASAGMQVQHRQPYAGALASVQNHLPQGSSWASSVLGMLVSGTWFLSSWLHDVPAAALSASMLSTVADAFEQPAVLDPTDGAALLRMRGEPHERLRRWER